MMAASSLAAPAHLCPELLLLLLLVLLVLLVLPVLPGRRQLRQRHDHAGRGCRHADGHSG